MSGSEPSPDDLLARRGELCAAAQLAALEGIVDLIDSDAALAELVAIDAALRARNVDPHGD